MAMGRLKNRPSTYSVSAAYEIATYLRAKKIDLWWSSKLLGGHATGTDFAWNRHHRPDDRRIGEDDYGGFLRLFAVLPAYHPLAETKVYLNH